MSDDIAILGVDNDELVCNISDTPLSSITVDAVNGGYQAGKLLHQLINKEILKPINIIVEPLMIEIEALPINMPFQTNISSISSVI